MVARMLKRRTPPTAYVFLNAPFAIEFAGAMAHTGRLCPRDFSVLSVIVSGWPPIHLPGSAAMLATIELPNFEVARVATRDLLARIQSGHRPATPRVHALPCRATWGESVGIATGTGRGAKL